MEADLTEILIQFILHKSSGINGDAKVGAQGG
jgi:hypothetical protein